MSTQNYYMNNLEFGKVIRTRRKELGWTQKQLSEKCGVAQSDISKMETGKTSMSKWYQLMKTLDIPVFISASPKDKIICEYLLGMPETDKNILIDLITRLVNTARESI